MKSRFKILFLVSAALVAMAPVQARQNVAVPSIINYQGALLDSVGNKLPDGNTNIVFRVYNSVFNGQLIWGPRTNSVALVGSVFNTLLGGVDADSRDFSQVLIGQVSLPNAPAFLELSVGGISIQPRQQILSAPFAFAANVAGRSVTSGFATNAGTAQLAQQAVRAADADRAAAAAAADNAREALHAANADRAQEAAHSANSDLAAQANRAVQADNANTLGGFDWSALLSTPDASKGYLDGIRISPGTIGLDRLKATVPVQDSASRQLRIVRGVVNGDASIVSGQGFTAKGSGTSIFISFNKQFSDYPAVTVTPLLTDPPVILSTFPPFSLFPPYPAVGSGVSIFFKNTGGGTPSSIPRFSFVAIGSD